MAEGSSGSAHAWVAASCDRLPPQVGMSTYYCLPTALPPVGSKFRLVLLGVLLGVHGEACEVGAACPLVAEANLEVLSEVILVR